MQELIETPLTWLHVTACFFLILVVLIQPGKSGGLGALGGAAATQVFGGGGAGNLLTRTTWVTAFIFFTTSLTLAYLSSSTTDSLESRAGSAEAAHDTLTDTAPAPEPDKK
jgi:preprotein translocase subunit SecG